MKFKDVLLIIFALTTGVAIYVAYANAQRVKEASIEVNRYKVEVVPGLLAKIDTAKAEYNALRLVAADQAERLGNTPVRIIRRVDTVLIDGTSVIDTTDESIVIGPDESGVADTLPATPTLVRYVIRCDSLAKSCPVALAAADTVIKAQGIAIDTLTHVIGLQEEIIHKLNPTGFQLKSLLPTVTAGVAYVFDNCDGSNCPSPWQPALVAGYSIKSYDLFKAVGKIF